MVSGVDNGSVEDAVWRTQDKSPEAGIFHSFARLSSGPVLLCSVQDRHGAVRASRDLQMVYVCRVLRLDDVRGHIFSICHLTSIQMK